jgi:hypothetical protein
MKDLRGMGFQVLFLHLRDEPDPVGGWGEITLACEMSETDEASSSS